MKKILLFLIFLTGIFAQSVDSTQITQVNLKEAVFYSRNVYNNVVFVGDIDATSDRDGQKIQGAVNTIAQAVTVANSLAPSSSNQVTIFVVDGRTYTETLTLPNYVNLIGIGATFSGITAGSTSSNIVQLSDVGGSISAGSVSFIPYGIITSTNVQNAIQELVDEKQDSSSRLTNIVNLTPQELALIQFNSDTLRVRTLDSLKVDLALVKADVDLSNVLDAPQIRNEKASFIEDLTAGLSLQSTDRIVVEQSADSLLRRYTIADIGAAAGGEANTVSNIGDGVGLFKQKVGVDFEFKSLANNGNVEFIESGDSVYANAPGGASVIIRRKTNDEIVNNSSTLQDDDDFTAPLEANTTYYIEIELYLKTRSNSAGDQRVGFKAGFSVPTGTTGNVTHDQVLGTFTNNVFNNLSIEPVYSTNLTNFGSSNWWLCYGGAFTGTFKVKLTAVITTSTTGGNIVFRWSQYLNDTIDTIIRKGSTMKIYSGYN